MIAERQDWRCENCGASLSAYMQLAHRIPQNDRNLRAYGRETIHHPLNMAGVCSLRCNAAVSIAGNPAKVKELVGRIHEEIGKKACHDPQFSLY
jgi:hypothetical protein